MLFTLSALGKSTVGDLLNKEHGDSRRAIRELMRQTGASKRTLTLVFWAPCSRGYVFLRLMFSSPVARAFVLGIIEGPVSEQTSPANDPFIRIAPEEPMPMSVFQRSVKI